MNGYQTIGCVVGKMAGGPAGWGFTGRFFRLISGGTSGWTLFTPVNDVDSHQLSISLSPNPCHWYRKLHTFKHSRKICERVTKQVATTPSLLYETATHRL